MPEIREVRMEDVPVLCELERQSFSYPHTEQQLIHEIENPSFCLTAVELEDGSVAGYAGMQQILDEGHITNVVVRPSDRGKGYATGLMQALKDRARERGITLLTLEVRSRNEMAIALYRKLGYQVEGRVKNCYQSPADDALIMTSRGIL